MFPQVSQNWRRGEFFFQDPEIRHGARSEGGVCPTLEDASPCNTTQIFFTSSTNYLQKILA